MFNSEPGEKSLMVLVIDGERAIRESIRNFLEDYKYQVLEAENGRIGLELFVNESPHLVMVDLQITEVDGLEVLAMVTKNAPNTPVIIMSGTGVIDNAAAALRLGAWDYLIKPIEDLTVLLHAVEKALERARLIRENRTYQEHLEEEVNRRTREVGKTAEELRQSEEKYRSIYENLQDIYYETRLDGTIAEISPSVESISKYTREEVLRRSLWEIYANPDDRKQLLEILKQTGKIVDYEINLLDKDGTVVPCSITAQIHVGRQGKPTKICGTIRNISERKRAEEERQKLLEQLHQAQKIEAIASLTGGIAHDFNNLLTVINGHTEIALRKLEKNLPLHKDLHAILQAGKRAENITRQLLTFGRKQLNKPKVININDVISHLENMLHRLIGEDIRMEKRFGQDVPLIKADPGQIEQILMNLVVNARDAIGEWRGNTWEKVIRIETERVELDGAFVKEHPGSHTGVHALLMVSDSGIGMDPEVKNKIFEPFFTTKEQGKGTGLGMSTVYGIVKQNNGSIFVYSKPGEGSTFKIYWPSTEKEELQTFEVEEVLSIDFMNGDETILLVEDDEGVRDFTSDTLREFGYTVFEAANGKEALELIKERKMPVDLLLTDLVMPEMNGKELAEKLTKWIPQAGVLYTSGYTDNHIIHNYKLKEGIYFIQKPYSIQALAKKVRDVLDRNKE
jgi:two-component system cell cycle sensor histidine kinase/response regulator CckA